MVDVMSLLKVCGSLGAIEFVASILASVLIALLAKSHTWCIIFGIILILAACVLLFFGFFNNSDNELRINHLTVGIPALVIGFTTCFLTERWMCTAGTLTRAVIFALIAFSVIGMLCFIYPFITNLVFKDVLEGASLNRTNEITLYVWSNFFLCFFYGLILGAPQTVEIADVYTEMIVDGIGCWFIGLVMFALLGLLINSKNLGGVNKALYDNTNLSSAEPTQ